MSDDFDTFPDPPEGVEILLDRAPHRLVVSKAVMPAFGDPRALSTIKHMSRFWSGGLKVMGASGALGCLTALSCVMLEFPFHMEGAEEHRVGLALGIFGVLLLWLGMLTVMLRLGQRFLVSFGEGRPLSGWRLTLELYEWRVEHYLHGTEKTDRCDPRTIANLAPDPEGRLIAELDDRAMTLTGPLSPDETKWLNKNLNKLLS